MAHFAKLDEHNKVIDVVVVNNDAIDANNEEESGIAFLTQVTGHLKWKQTSYNRAIRKKYAGIEDTYDEGLDAFIPPKPYNSWLLNEELNDWEAPVPRPTFDEENPKYYEWDEPSLSWVEHD